MTTSRTRMQATLLGAAVALAFTNAGAADIDLTGGYDICKHDRWRDRLQRERHSGSTGSGTFPAFVGTNGGRPDTFFMYNTTSSPLEDGNEVGNGINQNRDVTLGDFAVTDLERRRCLHLHARHQPDQSGLDPDAESRVHLHR